jgi:hypothetical protein
MTYMQEVDAWLNELLSVQGEESEAKWFARVKPAIRARLLESYRNGQKACPTCKPAKGSFLRRKK